MNLEHPRVFENTIKKVQKFLEYCRQKKMQEHYILEHSRLFKNIPRLLDNLKKKHNIPSSSTTIKNILEKSRTFQKISE